MKRVIRLPNGKQVGIGAYARAWKKLAAGKYADDDVFRATYRIGNGPDGNVGAEPARAESIAFTAAYCEIEATYLVPPGSTLNTVDEVDQPGRRIASAARSAYDLWLERNIEHAELVQVTGLDASFEVFVEQGLDALAGLRPRLITDV